MLHTIPTGRNRLAHRFLISRKKRPITGRLKHWRMVRDSNPRWSCPHNGFQDRRIRPLCQPSKTIHHIRSTGRIVHYFLRNANIKIANPTKNIIKDKSIPIVNQFPNRKPICASGILNCSQTILATAYAIPIIPANAPG